MWEISNSSQLEGFLLSMILGAFFGVFYDIFRASRMVKQASYVVVFIQDIIYFLIISFITFLFFLSITYGQIRFYILLGILLGFLLYLFTISPLFLKLISFVFKTIFTVIRLIIDKFYKLFDFLEENIKKFLIKFLNCSKKTLKMVSGLLYTNKR